MDNWSIIPFIMFKTFVLLVSVSIQVLTVINVQHMATLSSGDNSTLFPTVLEYIVITETPVPTSTPSPTVTPSDTPTPSITPILLESSELDELFTKYSSEYGVDRDLLRKIAVCESFLNPSAHNRDYGGMYQFSVNTWITTRRSMNLNTDLNLRFNPEEAIKTAAYKIRNGGASSWPNCL